MKLRLAIDVSAAKPDGSMGGQLTAVVYLIQLLLQRWRSLDLSLLTTVTNHAFFAAIAGANRLICLDGAVPPLPPPGLRDQLRSWLPGGGPRAPRSLQTLQADLLFCPFGGDAGELPPALRQLPRLGPLFGPDGRGVFPCVPSLQLKLMAARQLRLVSGLGLKGKKYLYYPANFWPHKNHEILLMAFQQLVRSGYDWQLVFTGALTDSRPLLRAAVAQMGLQQRVHFLGYVTEPQKAALCKDCYCLVMPGLEETLGLPLLEAMTFGRPIVCSDNGSLPGLAGEAALYFDPRKPFELVAALQRLATEPGLYAQLQQRGQARLGELSPQRLVDSYIDLFRQEGKHQA